MDKSEQLKPGAITTATRTTIFGRSLHLHSGGVWIMQQPDRQASMTVHLKCHAALRDTNISRSTALPGCRTYAGSHSSGQEIGKTKMEVLWIFHIPDVFPDYKAAYRPTYLLLWTILADIGVISVQVWAFFWSFRGWFLIKTFDILEVLVW